MTKTTKTSQITQSETLEKPADRTKPEEQAEGESSKPTETEQEEPASEPEQTKLEEAQPTEGMSE